MEDSLKQPHLHKEVPNVTTDNSDGKPFVMAEQLPVLTAKQISQHFVIVGDDHDEHDSSYWNINGLIQAQRDADQLRVAELESQLAQAKSILSHIKEKVEELKEKNPYRAFGNQESARHTGYTKALDDVLAMLEDK